MARQSKNPVWQLDGAIIWQNVPNGDPSAIQAELLAMYQERCVYTTKISNRIQNEQFSLPGHMDSAHRTLFPNDEQRAFLSDPRRFVTTYGCRPDFSFATVSLDPLYNHNVLVKAPRCLAGARMIGANIMIGYHKSESEGGQPIVLQGADLRDSQINVGHATLNCNMAGLARAEIFGECPGSYFNRANVTGTKLTGDVRPRQCVTFGDRQWICNGQLDYNAAQNILKGLPKNAPTPPNCLPIGYDVTGSSMRGAYIFEDDCQFAYLTPENCRQFTGLDPEVEELVFANPYELSR
jgi:hypothetical protein